MHHLFRMLRSEPELEKGQITASNSSMHSFDVLRASTEGVQGEMKEGDAARKEAEEQRKRQGLEALRQRYKGPITKEKLEEVHENYRNGIVERLAERIHPSAIGIDNYGNSVVVEEENLQGRIKLGMEDIKKAEDKLASSKNFGRKGRKSIHYMVKRAFDDEDLDALTNITIHHLLRSEHRAFAIDKEPASEGKGKAISRQVSAIVGRELVSDEEGNVAGDPEKKQSDNDDPIQIAPEKLSKRADTTFSMADTTFSDQKKGEPMKLEAPLEGSLESDERVIAMWKRQREIYRQRRDTKVDTSEYRASKRFTEIRRLKTTRKIHHKIMRVLAYPWSKRSLKQKLTFIHDQPQARYDHLQEKEARKSNRKRKRFIRWVSTHRPWGSTYRPYNQRMKRLRGRFGKEQGAWIKWMEMRKRYQRRFDEIYRDEVINELPYQRIKHDIETLFGKDNTPEAINARKAFELYRIEYRNSTGQAIKDQLSVLRSDLIEELRASEHRIVRQFKKISWNDITSIGSAPVTLTGTMLTILPYAGVAV